MKKRSPLFPRSMINLMKKKKEKKKTMQRMQMIQKSQYGNGFLWYLGGGLFSNRKG
jgi:hypothetical protein